MIKSRIKSPCVLLKCLIRIQFLWRKHQIYIVRFCSIKLANSHNFKIKKLNLPTITFLANYLLNRGKSSYIYQSSMRVNNTFRKIIDCYGERHCCQTSPVVFSKVQLRFFFLKHSPIDTCQIVTDTCKSNVSKFVWKPFKSPLSLRK